MNAVKTLCPNCGHVEEIFDYKTPADAARYWDWMAFEVCYNRFVCVKCGNKKGVAIPFCDAVISETEPPIQMLLLGD